MRLIDRRRAERAQATTWGSWGGEGSGTWAGVQVDTQSAMQLLTVHGCVRLIADGIGTLPTDVFREKPDGTREPVAPPKWVEQPTVDLDWTAWATQVLSSLLLSGNAYCWRMYDDSARLSELVPLDPTKVKIRRDRGRKVYDVAGKPATPLDILHIPGLMLPGSDAGVSPVEYARQTIGLGLAAQEYGARFFGQGATQTGVIEVPGDLPSDKAREIARLWERRHSGKSKAHLPGVLEGGAKWVSTGVTNEQAQFLQTRNFTDAEIAGQMFLVDPADLGIGVEGTSLTYANLEQRNLRRVQVTYLPWIVRLERAISAELARPRYLKLNVNGLLRADFKTRFEGYAIGVRNDFLQRSEIREWEDLPVIPGLDDRPLPTMGGPSAPAS